MQKFESSSKPLSSAGTAGQKTIQIMQFEELIASSPDTALEHVTRHAYKMLWTFAANCFLGICLITSPWLFDYRSPALATSDTVCGALVIILEIVSFLPRLAICRWGTALVAFWLMFAPLVFWSPTPAVFLIETMVAAFLITFAILVPGVPGKGDLAIVGPDQPPGWSYDPSSWIRRWLGIFLALAGFLISRYLAAHQLHFTPHAWDPFFGVGSDRVLTSSISRSFPISDAGFGAVAYILEVLTGFMGDRARWRTAPWIVLMFAFLVIPLGVTSVVLVMLQPVVVHAWCGLCLVAAAALVTSVPLAVHEVVAVGQFLLAARAQGKNMWSIFWMGGTIAGAGAGALDPDRRHYSWWQRWVASIQGVTVPWTLACQLIIGIWLMARPDLVPSGIWPANCDHLLGAAILTIAAVSTAEVTRTLRLFNIVLGAALAILALALPGNQPAVLWNEVTCGLIVLFLSIPKGEIVEKYGNWNKYVK